MQSCESKIVYGICDGDGDIDRQDDADEEDDAYMEEDNACQPSVYRCLFCHDAASRCADELLGQHLPDVHGIQLGKFLAGQGLRGQDDWVGLVAYLRAGKAGDSQEPRALLDGFVTAWRKEKQRRVAAGDAMGNGDTWPKVTDDDPLPYEVDIDELLAGSSPESSATTAQDTAAEELREARDEIASLRAQLAGMSALLRRLIGDEGVERPSSVNDQHNQAVVARSVAEVPDEDDQYYVDSYSGASIHAQMLLDRVRTGAYNEFISGNPCLFADRDVLDVGCGSGILSMFAARAGARVTAVDCADVIEEAKVAAAENDLSERIRFIKGKLETLEELKGDFKVDAIVSEWMGYFLLYEGMIESVIYARDTFLRPGGAVYPRICTLHICGLDSPQLYQRRVRYFENVYGVRMSYLRERGLAEAHVEFDLDPAWVATSSATLRKFDLLTARPEDTRFTAWIEIAASRDCTMHAIAGYFDTDFYGGGGGGVGVGGGGNDDKAAGVKNVTFSTGLTPTCPAETEAGGGRSDDTTTHWGQTVFCLRNPMTLAKGEVLKVGVTVGQPEGHPRGLCITVHLPDGTQSRYSLK